MISTHQGAVDGLKAILALVESGEQEVRRYTVEFYNKQITSLKVDLSVDEDAK